MATTVWKGHLTFGLVSLPIKLFSAARSETVSFNQLHKSDHSRVKQVLYCQVEDKPVPRSELVKGYEYEKDKYVVLDEEDVKKAAPSTARTMEILEFVKTDEVDPVYMESSYYVAPDEAGEKPYTLLFEGLKRTGYVALAKVAMHNREHIVIIRPGSRGMILHTMYYADEVRKVEEFRADTTLVKDKELELATTLIESLAAPFEPEKYKDSYRENLMEMIKAKVEGKQLVEAPTTEKLAPVIDIMEALKMSLAQAKKPVRSTTGTAAQAPVATETKEASAAKGKRNRKASAAG
ncbi:MAG TPA: Ku protein [Terriglobales bacterium]|nr:Ku protein [Terriglobales bacterium]